ncbi:MAG: AAA family ATPase [Bacillota bacterium]
MRIREVHIDGYGVFRDQHIQNLGDGVALFVGPNEAGKSTLMSFIRGVLFGFDRESQAGYCPPLAGGRHGGRLVVLMDDGEERVVQRYLERGQSRNPADVVGNMSKALYSNVFAFGLSELASLESLGSEEVRARIYSAGAGLGTRTLFEARRVLLSNLDRLYKRQGRVPEINALLREISDLENLIARLADKPAEYNELVRSMEQLAAERERIQEQLDKAKFEHLWFMTLRATRSTWEQFYSARAILDSLEMEDDDGALARREAVMALAPKIRRLKLAQESMVQLVDSIPGLEAVAMERRRSFEERLRELGGAWNEEAVESFDVSPGVVDEIRASRKRISRQDGEVQRLAEAVRARREVADEAESRLARQRERLEEFGELSYATRDDIVARISEIDSAEAILREVSVAEVRAEAAKGNMEAARIRVENATEEVQWRKEEVRRARGFASWLAPAMVAAFSLFAAFGMDSGMGLSIGVAVLGILGAAAIVASILNRAGDAGKKLEAAVEAARQADELFCCCRDQYAAASGEFARATRAYSSACLGLFGEEDIDGVRLVREREAARGDLAAWDEMARLRRECEQAERDWERAQDEWRKAEEAHRVCLDELERLWEEWRTWMRARGIDPTFGHDAAERTIDAVRDVARARQDMIDARMRLKDARERARRHAAEVNEVARSLGLPGTDVDGALVVVDELVAMVEQVEADQEKRVRARAVVNELAAQFGSAFPSNDLQRAEEYHLLHTAQEIADLCDDAESRRQALESELKKLAEEQGRKAEKRRLMEHDDEIAIACLELESAKRRLATQVEEWAAYRLCLELIDEACEKYERERQPQVLRDASEALARMTGGRWQSAIARVSGLDSLDVVDDNGRALPHTALSCGTEQQLYLAVRCGLVREYCSHAQSMPVMIDEALVNFDPERAEAAARVLADLADVTQILVFTCHPYMAECFRSTGRVTAQFELDGAEIRPLA